MNKELGEEEAAKGLADWYATPIERILSGMDAGCRDPNDSRWSATHWGGNRNLLIDCGQGLFYEGDGLLEEAFVHEAADGDSRSSVLLELPAIHSAAVNLPRNPRGPRIHEAGKRRKNARRVSVKRSALASVLSTLASPRPAVPLLPERIR